MKWPKKEARRQQIEQALVAFEQNVAPLPGMPTPVERYVLSRQIIASIRREEYFEILQKRGAISARRADPNDPAFEAEAGVVYLIQSGQIDEAAWLIFLMVFFAKPEVSGWTRLKDVYGKLGQGKWDWATVSGNPAALTAWLTANWRKIRGKFGNHRKYESMRPDANRPIGGSFATYIGWVSASGGHVPHFAGLVQAAGNDPHVIFDAFYRAIPVKGFGRLGRFDWVAMLARYGLIPAEAGSAYLDGATGPTNGAKLLFFNDRKANVSTADIQARLNQLDQHLNVGMEILEDSLCNWQKKPRQFEHFKG
ncbi:hypothetical protein EAO27_18790 [Sphingopyxis sp. YF1]|uniref:alpha-glutamyl/putrescinyl thymine pyrophosphorylase clade 3 protein n=1 Tax=Sphingopyxis sp. YF1 TaxID=2482763 RepID=UPI001F6261BE|nr:hypothetical protein [Sphingopyxis sp. YF1]UNU44529.1 hypothetical protein EAO27_18790 [Sphingopyxis sp. YF1]